MPSTSSASEYLPILEQSFEHWYASGRDAWSTEQAMRTMIAPILKARSASKLRILDIGTGRGADAAKLAQAGHIVTAIDLCRLPEWDAIEAKAVRRVTFIQQDFLEWKGAGPFDVVVDNGCFHHQHADNVEIYLGRIKVLLAPEGIFSLSVFHDAINDNDFEIILSDQRLVRIYAKSTLTQLLARNGLAVTQLDLCERSAKSFPYDYLHVTAMKELA